MTIVANAGATIEAYLEADTGVQVGVQVVDPPANDVVVARSTDVTEFPAGSGLYVAVIDLPAADPSPDGQPLGWAVVWDGDGVTALEELRVYPAGVELPDAPPPGPDLAYITRAAARAASGDPDLSDDDAALLALAASDLADHLLGARPVDPGTGRKVLHADVEEWRWRRFLRAVGLLARDLHADPRLADGRRWGSERGPDFSFSDPRGPDVAVPLSTLVVLYGTGLQRGVDRAGRQLASLPLSSARLP